MHWYPLFNTIEALLWWIVAGAVLAKTPQENLQQRHGAVLGAAAFFAFGISDFLEAAVGPPIPLWLWGVKCLCGTAILAARYTWLGWSRFRWTDREVLFALGCLLAVILLIVFQSQIDGAKLSRQDFWKQDFFGVDLGRPG